MNTPSLLPAAARPNRVARWLRRAAFTVAVTLTAIALYYAEENWRGRRAWEKCKTELEAKGERLDWAAYVPARVPDDQNFIKTPLLEAVGYRGRVDTNVWSRFQQAGRSLAWDAWGDPQNGRLMNWPDCQVFLRRQSDLNLSPLPQEPAADLLQAFEDIEPQLEELRIASLRPLAQFDIDRSAPFEEWPDFNFVAIRQLSQILAFRSCAELALGHRDKSFADVRVIHRLSDGLKNENTLVATMIRVALQGLAMQAFWEGWAEGRWGDRELAAFEELFSRIDLLPEFVRVMRAERAGITALVEKYGIRGNQLWRVTMRSEQAPEGWSGRFRQQAQRLVWGLVPRGWVYQNLVALNRQTQALLVPSLQARPPTVSPVQIEQLMQRRQKEHPTGPYGWLAGNATPNFSRAAEGIARNQNLVNQARTVCALERYRTAHGRYPESLSELTPRFVARLPIDVITGQPLKYRRGKDGGFVLYSVGWDEKDDGGVAAMTNDEPSKPDFRRGDWVWRYPVKE